MTSDYADLLNNFHHSKSTVLFDQVSIVLIYVAAPPMIFILIPTYYKITFSIVYKMPHQDNVIICTCKVWDIMFNHVSA